MKTYDVSLTREGKWWMVSIPEIDGLTQAKTIKEAHDMAKDYIAITQDVPADSFEINVRAEKIGRVEHVTQLLEDIKIARAKAEAFEQEAADESRELAAALAGEELPLREIGAVMGVSHQRADQLVRSGTGKTFAVDVKRLGGFAMTSIVDAHGNTDPNLSRLKAHLSRAERAEMLRGHVGIVTALIAGDDSAIQHQIASIVREQIEASDGDLEVFTGRMSKQLEASARVTRALLMSLAPRLDKTESETLEDVASVLAGSEITEAMNE